MNYKEIASSFIEATKEREPSYVQGWIDALDTCLHHETRSGTFVEQEMGTCATRIGNEKGTIVVKMEDTGIFAAKFYKSHMNFFCL